jgi:Tol biopolymer transport system component
MNADGTNQMQLTNGTYEDMPQITSDGKWVIYHSARKDGKIWKVSIDGGAPLPLLTKEAIYPAVSPDGKMLASFVWDENPNSSWELGMFSLIDLTSVKTFAVPASLKISTNKLRWSPDSQALVYVNDVNGVSNLWIQSLDQATPKQLTNFTDSRLLFDFAWSPNRQQLACVRGDIVSRVILIKGLNLN